MHIDENKLRSILADCLQLKKENEWIEYKENFHSVNELGETISALANGACITDQPCAYLFFGIKDNLDIVGTKFDPDTKADQGGVVSLVILNAITKNHRFEKFVFYTECGNRIVSYIIDAAKNTPVEYKSQSYIRIESHNQNLSKYPALASKIWRKDMPDWSAQICEHASLNDLDPDAIKKARQLFFAKNSHLQSFSTQWDDLTFLDKAKITINQKITNTAIILLGKPESEHLINPATARITWILRDANGIEKDYAHFFPPLLLRIDDIYAKIRNLKFRYIQEGSLFPEEIDQYDPYIIREALNNCIAHQDYTLGGNIVIVEKEDATLTLTNHGGFIPQSIFNVISNDSPAQIYRNRFLSHAMVNINMIDTIGSGIKKMFNIQKERFFPLPDYDLTDNKVCVKITGKILDLNYARLLSQVKDLTLSDIILLDKLQKRQEISTEDIKYLKSKKLIEGKKPNLIISSRVAAQTDQHSQYLSNKDHGNIHYEQCIVTALNEFGKATRSQIDAWVMPLLPQGMSEEQKKNRVKNLLQQMRSTNQINYKNGKWIKL